MRNKFLNIIGIIAIIITIIIAWSIKKEENMFGNFNNNALVNAEEIVKNAIAENRKEIENLVKIENKTYMNFIRPLMDADGKLSKIITPIYNLDMVNNSDETKKIVETIQPWVSDLESDMAFHKGLYDGTIYIKKNEYDNLDFAQKKVIDESIKSFEIAGIALPKNKQAKLKEINQKLSKLSNDFSNNLILANKGGKIKILDEKLLGKMPEFDKTTAKIKDEDGWEFSLLAPSYIAFTTYVVDESLRQKMYKNYNTRASENENIITQILKLRDDKAKILGFENYAQLGFQFKNAKTPENAKNYLTEIIQFAKPAADKEFTELCEFAGKKISPWDIAFYTNTLQKEKYDVDSAEIKPYFELNHTVTESFKLFEEMFGIKFIQKKKDLWDDGAKFYEIHMGGKLIAGLYTDLQTRESKGGGAWAMSFERHHKNANNETILPLVNIVANFSKESENQPALLSISDTTTLFHEMGHAMHNIMSKVDEAALAGTSVDWDVVEFPSQFLDLFTKNPTILKRISRHYKTGEKIPDELINRIEKAANFQYGMAVVRQLELGLFDLNLHMLNGASPKVVQKTLDDVRDKVSVYKFPKYNKFQHGFAHIFSSGYAAGYYSYKWAYAMAADAYMEFKDNPYNKELLYKYRDTVLALGGSKDMDEIYIEFLGRKPKPESQMKLHGLLD